MARKSKSKELRDILWVLRSKRIKKPGQDEFDFEIYYTKIMDKIINHFAMKIG